jgi:hypothetical protein
MKLFDEQIVAVWRQAWNDPAMTDHVAVLRRGYVSDEFARVRELRDLALSPDPLPEPPTPGGRDEEVPGRREGALRPAVAEATGISDDNDDDENQDGSSNDGEAPNKRRRIDIVASEAVDMSEPVCGKGTSAAGDFALGMDYTPSQHILIVGDGDFSFSASLVALLQGQQGGGGGGGGAPRASSIVATALDTAEAVRATFRSAPINLALLGLVGAAVAHGVDARTLPAATTPFDRVVFNFPSYGHERGAGATARCSAASWRPPPPDWRRAPGRCASR